MDARTAARANLAISVLFAITMLATSWFLQDKDLSQNIVLVLIAVWMVPFLYLGRKAGASNEG